MLLSKNRMIRSESSSRIDATKQKQNDDVRQNQIDAASKGRMMICGNSKWMLRSKNRAMIQAEAKRYREQKQNDDVVLEKDKTDSSQDSNLKDNERAT